MFVRAYNLQNVSCYLYLSQKVKVQGLQQALKELYHTM